MFNPQVSALKYANRNPQPAFKFQVSGLKFPLPTFLLLLFESLPQAGNARTFTPCS